MAKIIYSFIVISLLFSSNIFAASVVDCVPKDALDPLAAYQISQECGISIKQAANVYALSLIDGISSVCNFNKTDNFYRQKEAILNKNVIKNSYDEALRNSSKIGDDFKKMCPAFYSVWGPSGSYNCKFFK